MTSHALDIGIAAQRDEGGTSRTSWSMIVSTLLHTLALLLFLLARPVVTETPALTEITMLDPGDLSEPAGGEPTPAAAPQTAEGALTSQPTEKRFRRQDNSADMAPEPQGDALDDRINARLASLQNASSAPSIGTVASARPSMWATAPASVPGTGGGGQPLALTRGGSGGGAPLALTRGGGGHGLAPALAPATPHGEGSASETPAKGGDAGVRRTLAGVTLMGPVADRPIISHVAPEYPDWAKREAVEGSVTLMFIVRPDGTIKENILVQKTAGFEDFDENARTALRAWRFQPLRDGRVGEQWGTITFHFRLRDGG